MAPVEVQDEPTERTAVEPFKSNEDLCLAYWRARANKEGSEG